METSPYAPPVSEPASPPSETGAEAIRRAHIGHENALNTIGRLLFVGPFAIPIDFYERVVAWLESRQLSPIVVWVSAAMLLLFIDIGVTKFRTWARWPGPGLVVLLTMLCNVSGWNVLVLLIGILYAFLLLSKKSTMIFSPVYSEIRAATPQVRYKDSPLAWVAHVLVMILIFYGVLRPSGIFS